MEDVIQEAIRANGGRIPFERFMELALYYPSLGYYTKGGQSPVGKGGDFVTSVSLGPLFGRILAQAIRQFRDELNDPEFSVVEYGAHRGELRDQILAELPGLNYIAVDVGAPFVGRVSDPAGDEAASSRRRVGDPAYNETDNRELTTVTGCILANEFLDALPVHRVHAQGGQWLEWYVENEPDHDGFLEVLGPLSSPRIADALRMLPVHLMEGYTTEVNLRALDWLEDIALRLSRGYVLLIDYGYERLDYFAPHRSKGTLTCYRDHRRGDDPLLVPGSQDITAHVEFSSFLERAKHLGFSVERFEDQGRFLLKTGEGLITKLIERDAGQFSALRGTLNQLTHPSMMGQAFRVLVLRKHEQRGERPG